LKSHGQAIDARYTAVRQRCTLSAALAHAVWAHPIRLIHPMPETHSNATPKREPGPAAPGADHAAAPQAAPHGHGASTTALMIGAVGIVYGDIGTSPLYTVQECVGGEHGVPATHDNVLGILSLIVWSLTFVVTIKYLVFVMRADNRGEGGILALLALVPERARQGISGHPTWIAILVLAGAALLFGDGIITPAISVLSAMEGLGVATTKLRPAIVPLTVAILALLFAIQRRGTGGIGRLFGPVMVVWFATIGFLGARHLIRTPAVLGALWPGHGVHFFAHHGWHGFRLLGSVVLAVTGGEALYADMGHFGRKPIRLAWLALVFPSLLLCYFGQGALLLARPSAAAQPFFNMVPAGAWTYALVALAAPATVIASQALISGVFSLTHQAIRLGFFPRVEVKHTSSETEGQIYVPFVNWTLAIACILLVLIFRRSTRLAAAFGLAVSGTMAITSVVYYVVTRQKWKWSAVPAVALLLLFLSFDLPFLIANLMKFFDGGYLPLAVGSIFFLVMVIWRRGRTFLARHYATTTETIGAFIARIAETPPARTPGVGVFMASSSAGVPPVLKHFLRRTGSMPATIVLLTLSTERIPFVPESERVEVSELGDGLWRVVGRYGFMDTPNVQAVIARAAEVHSAPIDPATATYYLGRETFLATEKGRMGVWTEGLFAFLSRNARSATAYFHVPPEQVVEIGLQLDL